MGRYQRNGTCINPQETELLHSKKICVVGCGGLGGYLIEMLSRAGVGHLTTIDADVFEPSNLNRQLLSNDSNLGSPKAEEAVRRIGMVNPQVEVIPRVCRVTDENVDDLLAGHDLVMDAVDSISTRLILEDSCERLGIPLVHGAIGGWYGQVSVVYPGDGTMHQLYVGAEERGAEAILGTPSFTPAAVAAAQVGEAIKVLLRKGEVLRRQLLYIDLLEHNYQVLPLNDQANKKENA